MTKIFCFHFLHSINYNCVSLCQKMSFEWQHVIHKDVETSWTWSVKCVLLYSTPNCTTSMLWWWHRVQKFGALSVIFSCRSSLSLPCLPVPFHISITTQPSSVAFNLKSWWFAQRRLYHRMTVPLQQTPSGLMPRAHNLRINFLTSHSFLTARLI